MNPRSNFFFPVHVVHVIHHLFIMLSSFFSYSFIDQPIMFSLFLALTCLLCLCCILTSDPYNAQANAGLLDAVCRVEKSLIKDADLRTALLQASTRAESLERKYIYHQFVGSIPARTSLLHR
ncbi:hypothetical protein EDD16DRAFT_1625526 [Pisolithus croceorrhizus]|nr:hypothetical protein EDD16DRAFT_1625526 [Pisolithus croceorrhizus]